MYMVHKKRFIYMTKFINSSKWHTKVLLYSLHHGLQENELLCSHSMCLARPFVCLLGS